MLLVDLRQAPFELADLKRELQVRLPERVEFDRVSGLLRAEVRPFFAELVLQSKVSAEEWKREEKRKRTSIRGVMRICKASRMNSLTL